MVSTFTPNIQLEEPARGDQVGVWDTPVNSNMTEIDLVVGAVTTIGLNNSPVVLAAAQFRSKTIIFNSTLTGNVTITFPTSFSKSYEIYNQCTGSSAFVITLATTAGGNVVCAPPGEPVDIINLGAANGGTIVYKNLGRIGSYWDYGGSSVPNWVSGCSVPPYLNCDGTTFSAATFPTLAIVLGSTTLPDTRGRYRATLNQGTARITSGTSTGGVDGNTAYASGGAQTTTLSSQNMPPVPVTDPGHAHNLSNTVVAQPGPQGLAAGAAITLIAVTALSAVTNITAGSSSPTNFSKLPPTVIGGITMIRAG